MTDYKATPEQWGNVQKFAAVAGESCILELRARVEALEAAAHKHIVETNSNIVALFARVESLEATERGASKVYEISKPLKLTPDQVEQLLDQLRPTFKRTPSPSQSSSSLVERVGAAIFEQFENNAGNEAEARTAIREVAAWMRENQCGYNAVRWLEQEAEQ